MRVTLRCMARVPSMSTGTDTIRLRNMGIGTFRGRTTRIRDTGTSTLTVWITSIGGVRARVIGTVTGEYTYSALNVGIGSLTVWFRQC